MKAYKCPECGYLNEIIGPFGASLILCPDCDYDFTSGSSDKVELIDWEKELLS